MRKVLRRDTVLCELSWEKALRFNGSKVTAYGILMKLYYYDNNWSTDSRILGLKENLLSDSFDKQRHVLRKIKELNPNNYTREEIFLLGRLVMWAAFANCFDCQNYVRNTNEIADFYTGKEIPFFDGMLLKHISTMRECLGMVMPT